MTPRREENTKSERVTCLTEQGEELEIAGSFGPGPTSFENSSSIADAEL